MFLCCTKFNGNISRWNVHNVTSMEGMFRGCHNFNIDISRWNVEKVFNMKEMFFDCRKLTKKPQWKLLKE